MDESEDTTRLLGAVARLSRLPKSAPLEQRALDGVLQTAFAQSIGSSAFLLGLGWCAAAYFLHSPATVLAAIAGSWLISALVTSAAAKRSGQLAAGCVTHIYSDGHLSAPRIIAVYDLLVPNRPLRMLSIAVALLLWIVALVLTWSDRGPRALLTLLMLAFTWRLMNQWAMMTASRSFRRALDHPFTAWAEVAPRLDYETSRYELRKRPRWVDAPWNLGRRDAIFAAAVVGTWLLANARGTAMTWAYASTITALWVSWLILRMRGPAVGDFAVCRAPVAPRVSRYLAHHVTHGHILDAAWVAFASASFIDSQRLVVSVLTLAPFTFVTTMVLVPATLVLLRAFVSARMKILVFRRFSKEEMIVHRQVLLPLLGAYGAVTALSDSHLEGAPRGPSVTTEEALSGIFDLGRGGAEWMDQIRHELRDADLVVFHWPGRPTENMAAEYFAAIETVPSERLLWVTTPEGRPAVTAWLSGAAGARETPHLITASDETPFEEISGVIYRQMRRLKPVPRPRLHQSASVPFVT